MDLQIAKEVAIDFMEEFDLFGKGWTFEFNDRKRAYGMAHYGKKKIYLSNYLVPRMDYSDVKDTVLHEIAHAIDFIENKGRGHGASWKRVARRIGADPKASHEKIAIPLEKQDYKYTFECECGQWYGGHRVSKGAKYGCGKCGKELTIKQNY